MMKPFSEFITEEKKTKKPEYHAFDLDNTLVSHDNNKLRIHVLNQHGERTKSLSSQEFNTHKLPKDHSYDFSEFESSDVFGKSSKPIHKMIHKLKAAHRNGHRVEIITARADLDDQKKFAHHMKKFGIDIDKIHVRRAGNLNMKAHKAKAQIVDELVKKNRYDTVHLYDDSHDNLNEFLGLHKKNPGVEFNAHHVTHHPKTGEVRVDSKTAMKEKPEGKVK